MPVKYKTYPTLIEQIERVAKNRRAGLQTLMALPPCIDQVSIIDELLWESKGGDTIFIDTPGLAGMLERARVKLEGGPLPKWPFEGTVAIAMPAGYDLPPALFSFLNHDTRRSFVEGRFSKEVGKPVDYATKDSDEGISVLFKAGEMSYSRTAVPMRLMPALVEADTADDARNVIGQYPLLCTKNTDEEIMASVRLLKLYVGLSAYLEAKPDALFSGPPGQFHRREFSSRGFLKTFTLSTVKGPPGLGSERGTVSSHYRCWYFRRYPLKADGTRKDGMVFVSDTVVGANVKTSTATGG